MWVDNLCRASSYAFFTLLIEVRLPDFDTLDANKHPIRNKRVILKVSYNEKLYLNSISSKAILVFRRFRFSRDVFGNVIFGMPSARA